MSQTLSAGSSSAPALPDPGFLKLASAWQKDQADVLWSFVWQGYDRMKKDAPVIDGRDLERSITQLLCPRIDQALTGDEPFYVMHGPSERETMLAPPAQPPEYDIAFVLKSDETIMWPMEAKVLETSGAVAEYVNDVRDQFLTCRYAPFTNSGAMLGYLLSGKPDDVFRNIAAKVPCTLEPSATTRAHQISRHSRSVPTGKTYPKDFSCHHLILEYHGVSRHKP